MSSPTSSKAPVRTTITEIHSAAAQSPSPASPRSPAPPTHQPTRTTTFPDEKSQDYAVTINPSHDDPPVQTPLQIFHSALGIPPPKPPKPVKPTKKNPNPPPPTDKPKLTAKNKGVYSQVLSCERNARWKYLFCDFSVTIAMFLQIIVGASVTAFGAGNSSHVLITVFGAANTALASLLAVLKSQGLPNRIRQDWNGWRELREYIEEKEREIEMAVSGRVEGVQGPKKLDVWETVRAIEARYNAVRLTAEANRPDTYIKVPLPALPK
jgi:SMODS and SLOG-associating 2TM effector domain